MTAYAQERPAGQLLLVEDNAGDAELIQDLLEEAGSATWRRFTVTPTLAAAAKALDEHHVDAVLLDLGLPDGSGLECIHFIRARAPETPIVVLTGQEDAELALRCLDAGAQDYLPKSEARAQPLLRAIAYAIARVREAAARRQASIVHAQHTTIVEASSDAILSATIDGRITEWNRGAERIFGFTKHEAIGQPIGSVMRMVEGAELDPTGGLLRAAIGGQVTAEERVYLRKNGQEVFVSVMACVLFDAVGEQTGVATICRDITEKKHAELQLLTADRMAAMGTLVAGVAHEINNPLAAVIANLSLIRETMDVLGEKLELPSELHVNVGDAAVAAQRVREIVRDLKVFSRGEEDHMTSVDVEKVLSMVLRMAANETRHRARVVKAFSKVPPVTGNETRLGQVFLNLVVNAAQAIPEGRATANEIRVSTKMDGDMIVVTVADTGVGIPTALQARLFSPFFTTKPVGEGTGLGLALSYRIVHQMGGAIRFSSVEGQGTEFHVSLQRADAQVSEPPASTKTPTRAKRRGRILVIDDEIMIANAVKRILSQHDVIVEERSSIAIERLREGERFDLILCDLMMPEQTGMDVFEVVKELSPEQADRMVFVTGGAFTARAREFLETVTNRRVDKPFDPKSLRALINELVR